MFTARIAYSADFFQSQVPRTKRYLLYDFRKQKISVPSIRVFYFKNISDVEHHRQYLQEHDVIAQEASGEPTMFYMYNVMYM